jgi:hypothetical protein
MNWLAMCQTIRGISKGIRTAILYYHESNAAGHFAWNIYLHHNDSCMKYAYVCELFASKDVYFAKWRNVFSASLKHNCHLECCSCGICGFPTDTYIIIECILGELHGYVSLSRVGNSLWMGRGGPDPLPSSPSSRPKCIRFWNPLGAQIVYTNSDDMIRFVVMEYILDYGDQHLNSAIEDSQCKKPPPFSPLPHPYTLVKTDFRNTCPQPPH